MRIGTSSFIRSTSTKKWSIRGNVTLTETFLGRIGFLLGKGSIAELTELERINNNRAVVPVELEISWACQDGHKTLTITKNIILYFTNYRGVPFLLN